jgi:hypothetical protein
MSQPSPTSGGGPPGARQTAERRAWIRFRSRHPEVFWQTFGSKDLELWPAEVLNLSARGIGLILDRPVTTGTVLAFKLSKNDFKARSFLVRVKHVTGPVAGKFTVGATFVVPLSEEQLHALAE